MSKHGSCACCGRDYRSAAARQHAERRAAILASLRDNTPCDFLPPLSEPDLDKRERKNEASRRFVLQGETA